MRIYSLFIDKYSNIRAFLNDCIMKLRHHAQFFHAAEVDGLMGEHLFSYGPSILQRLRTQASDRERQLNADDLEMCDL